MKGHDFSRADKANRISRALAPEGSQACQFRLTADFFNKLLSRLFDVQTQVRVRLEAEAVEYFFQLLALGRVECIASDVVQSEIVDNPDEESRIKALEQLALCGSKIALGQSAILRGESLELLGYGAFDALHVVCAEEANADCLLTTDDRFLRRAKRGVGNPRVRILNPVNWRKGVGP